MKFSFKAKIYKIGINACVQVPFSVTEKMKPVKGYIPVKGRIRDHDFTQTLCPVKGEPYRLYVNIPMLKGGNAEVGESVDFTIEQNHAPRRELRIPMHGELKRQLLKYKLLPAFEALTVARKKDILKYLHSLKTEEALGRNIERVIKQLREKKIVRIP